MELENNRRYVRMRMSFLLISIAVLGAGLFGWWIGQSNDSTNNNPSSNTPPASTDTPAENLNANEPGVKSLVKYTLPDGWKEAGCPSAAGAVFVTPSGAGNVDCDANPSAPVKISVDSANNTDCNQLQNVQNVSKHICISEFINGHKTLKAETIYNNASPYKKSTAVNAYYINTGKGVIKVEYVRGTDNNEYLAGLEQLAKSVQVK